MPKLRERLKKPETYLALVAILALAMAADSVRSPDRQFFACAYVELVGLYQSRVSPRLRSYVRCRYRPTCSEYSLQAVARRGLLPGLWMSIRRTLSCRPSVPLGTMDPVR
jgi:hypothetical protein